MINWGAKKLFSNHQLEDIVIKVNGFRAYLLIDGGRNDRYHFSTMKKSENSNKLYQITD